jgi:hypothetical protein
MLSFKNFIQENWFEKNDNTHLPRRKSISDQFETKKPSKDEASVLKRYIKDSKPVNQSLLAGNQHPDVEKLNSFINNNKMQSKLHTYSALGFDPEKKLDSQRKWKSEAYLSVTPHKDIAKDYATKDENGIQHIAHITLNTNDPAAHIGTHEDEFLIQQGVTYKHHGSIDVEEGNKKFRIHKMSIE